MYRIWLVFRAGNAGHSSLMGALAVSSRQSPPEVLESSRTEEMVNWIHQLSCKRKKFKRRKDGFRVVAILNSALKSSRSELRTVQKERKERWEALKRDLLPFPTMRGAKSHIRKPLHSLARPKPMQGCDEAEPSSDSHSREKLPQGSDFEAECSALLNLDDFFQSLSRPRPATVTVR